MSKGRHDLPMHCLTTGNNTIYLWMRVVKLQRFAGFIGTDRTCFAYDQITGGYVPLPARVQGNHSVKLALRDKGHAIGQ